MQPGHKANQSSTANDGKSAELPQQSPSLISTSSSLPPSLPRSLMLQRTVLSHGPSSLSSGLITTLVSQSLSSHSPASAGTKWITLIDTRAVQPLCINIHCFTNIFLTSVLFYSYILVFFYLSPLFSMVVTDLFSPVRSETLSWWDSAMVSSKKGTFTTIQLLSQYLFYIIAEKEVLQGRQRGALDNAKTHFFWQHLRLTGNKSAWQPAVARDLFNSFVKELDSGSPYGKQSLISHWWSCLLIEVM